MATITGYGWIFVLIAAIMLAWITYAAVQSREVADLTETPSERDLETSWGAEELLKERYARGEIDRDTYEHMLEDLRRPAA